MMPDATSGAGAGSYAAAMTALTEIEGKQLAFASEAASAAEARYRETQVLLKRLGLKPSRFVRQSKLAMGGPYEPVGEDSDPAFRKLFSSWSTVNTLEQGMLSVPSLKPVRSYEIGRASCRERVCQYV